MIAMRNAEIPPDIPPESASRPAVPARWRSLVREDEVWLVVLAGIIGVLSGACVAGMVGIIHAAHKFLFDVSTHDVSGATYIDPLRALSVPLIGGILLGVLGLILSYAKQVRIVDPIEANALHGGRVGFRGSLIITSQTMLSNGFGASVGMEAAYTQIAAALASKLGRFFRLRRSDMRTLVGCGAAGAIAAAFDAPLTGAFYAFELIIAAYSIATLAPVVVAAITATTTMRLLMPLPAFEVGYAGSISAQDFTLIIVTGVICAFVAILMMKSVSWVETGFKRARIPAALRPAVGGLIVGLLALLTPTVLSSGHSALQVGFGANYPADILLVIIVTKIIASAVSIGSGFRGGLFFASLLLGAMIGKFMAIGWMISFGLIVPAVVIGIVGMGAMAAAVVGAPLTMVFLTLETTGSLPLTTAVLAATVVSSLVVRKVFGYSFTTWRFHLRGESIRSAADIGWVRDLAVGRLMRKDPRIVRIDTSIVSLRRSFPLGSTQRVLVQDEKDRYRGMVMISDLHRVSEQETELSDLLLHKDAVLLPAMNLRDAITAFSAEEADALAVVEDESSMRIIGLLTEQHALRRYNEELDQRMQMP